MERVRVYAKSGMPSKNGKGLYADVLMRALPLVPVEEEGRLNDAKLRENFIVRVFSYHRLLVLFSKRFMIGDLVRFHTIHKFLMLAHSPGHYALLGRLVAGAKHVPRASLEVTYGKLFMEGLQVKTSTKKNVNVLQHIMGFLRDHLADGEKSDILNVIEDYRHGIIPLIVPLTLLRHYVQKHSVEYINDQIYLHPHPKELMLRNHV